MGRRRALSPFTYLLLCVVVGSALAGFGQQAAPSGQAAGKKPTSPQTAPPTPQAAPGTKQGAPVTQTRQKLILTDGSDQIVREWQRNGERVRYFSLERNEWEELPASLVDWKATEEANRAEQAATAEKAAEAAQIERENKQEWLGPELVPGVRLPNNSDGLFVVADGKPLPLPKQQAGSRLDKGRLAANVALPIPVLKSRTLVEIPGARAAVRLAAPLEALFAAGRARDDSRYALALLKPKGNVRQVETIEVGMLGRNPTHAGDYLELDSQTIAPGVFKLTPRRPILPGEYAVVEFIGKDLNMYMWDFAVEK